MTNTIQRNTQMNLETKYISETNMIPWKYYRPDLIFYFQKWVLTRRLKTEQPYVLGNINK